MMIEGGTNDASERFVASRPTSSLLPTLATLPKFSQLPLRRAGSPMGIGQQRRDRASAKNTSEAGAAEMSGQPAASHQCTSSTSARRDREPARSHHRAHAPRPLRGLLAAACLPRRHPAGHARGDGEGAEGSAAAARAGARVRGRAVGAGDRRILHHLGSPVHRRGSPGPPRRSSPRGQVAKSSPSRTAPPVGRASASRRGAHVSCGALIRRLLAAVTRV